MKTTVKPQKAVLVSKEPPHIRLAAARRKRGVSQETMAGWLDITQGYLSQLERGIRPATPELLKKWKSML